MTTGLTLYKMTDDMRALEELLDGDLDGQEDAAAKLQTEITCMLQTKIDNVVYFNEYMEDTIEAVEKRLGQLKALKATLENKQTSFHGYILACMEKLEAQELRGEIKKVMVKKPSKRVEIESIDSLPVEFLRTVPSTVEPIKTEISKALKAGKEVPGARLVDGPTTLKLSNITL
jgi:hypothetical protein